jgi:hypothetical protein
MRWVTAIGIAIIPAVDTRMMDDDRRNLRNEPEQRSADEQGLAREAAGACFHARVTIHTGRASAMLFDHGRPRCIEAGRDQPGRRLRRQPD